MEIRTPLEQMRVRESAQRHVLTNARERRDIAEREVAALLSELNATKRGIYALERAAAVPGLVSDDTAQGERLKADFETVFGFRPIEQPEVIPVATVFPPESKPEPARNDFDSMMEPKHD